MIIRLKFKYKYLYAVILFIVIFLTALVLARLKSYDCSAEEPVDVVYTWVNGSDELFLNDLSDFLQKHNNRKIDVSTSRYTDRYELKFSLRSLEKYAPWIRNVYIVTNGQIPYWLNLDYGKVILVTHEEIFTNPSDLPTFSSPAIETHLHRIPGISQRFLYFNDDIYLGAPVHIEDFLSPSRGILLYLHHPLQSCTRNCPWLYVHDGQCDKECNNLDCQLDGGDCEEDRNNTFIKRLHVNDTEDTTYLNTTRLDNATANVEASLNASHVPQNDTHFKILFSRLSNIHTADIEDVVLEHNKKVLRRNKMKRRYAKKGKARYFQFVEPFNAYMESLQHTNRIYNLKYGFVPRYVPAHMPFLIDVGILRNLQLEFEDEIVTTSANKVRSGNDVQFAFSYYYYIFHERTRLNVAEIFDMFDTDNSGTWSDREIRTILTKLYKLPLNYDDVDAFDSILINCSKLSAHIEVTVPEYERYVDSKLPTISKDIVCNWGNLTNILQKKFGSKPKYKHEIIADLSRYVTFQMLTSNAPDTIKKLDGLRQKPTKFVCLNDNTNNESASVVNALWYDFYISLFPNPSRFELPTEYRNRFSYVKDLRSYHFRLRLYFYVCLLFLSYVTACVLCRKKVVSVIRNKLFR